MTVEKDDDLANTDQYSKMGDFVNKVIKTKGEDYSKMPADYRTVELPTKFNKRLRKKVKVPETIHQDSVLIKHDFDAGRSKLTQQIDAKKKAEVRMSQLMAMLRHKDAKVNLEISD